MTTAWVGFNIRQTEKAIHEENERVTTQLDELARIVADARKHHVADPANVSWTYHQSRIDATVEQLRFALHQREIKTRELNVWTSVDNATRKEDAR